MGGLTCALTSNKSIQSILPSHACRTSHAPITVCAVVLGFLTYTGCKASLLTSMRSMARGNRLTARIRSDITISMERQTWRARLERLYRPTMMNRHASSPRLASMEGMDRKTRLTRMVSLARLRGLIRG